MIRRALIAAGRGLSLFALCFVQLAAFVWTVVALSLLPAFVGIFLVPGAVLGLRAVARLSRHRALVWSGVRITEPYDPPRRFQSGFVGQIERCRHVLTDIATYRDLIWALANPVIGGVLALLPAALLLYGVEGLLMPVLWENFHPYGFRDWYVGMHVTSRAAAWTCVPLGAGILVLTVRNADRLLGVHARWNRVLLGPLAGFEPEPRPPHPRAFETQDAELRRIERDLHDGAQARLVAM
ncbi:sensor domain-containing protein, partial [Actinocorallia lasiicapitis]